MKNFFVIAAIDSEGGIGKNGTLPWSIKSEMAYFKRITSIGKTSVCIMGRVTWESIPEKFRPLSDRLNIVVTSGEIDVPGVVVARSLDLALEACPDNSDPIWIIGGAKLYSEAVSDLRCRAVFLSRINKNYDCDTFFPKMNGVWLKEAEEDYGDWSSSVYVRKEGK